MVPSGLLHVVAKSGVSLVAIRCLRVPSAVSHRLTALVLRVASRLYAQRRYSQAADVISQLESVRALPPEIARLVARTLHVSAEQVSVRVVSDEKSRKLLKWKPEISLEAGLKSVADCLGFKTV